MPCAQNRHNKVLTSLHAIHHPTMKLTRLSILAAALTGAGGAFAAPIPADMAGSYQALLYSQQGDIESPHSFATATLSTKGVFTGKLTTQDNKTYAFSTKTALDYTALEATDEDGLVGSAAAATVEIKRPKMDSLFLTLTFKDYEGSDVLEVSLVEADKTIASTDEGFKQITFAKGAEPYDAAGTYTAAFELAEAPGQNEPAGSGYALGKIDAKGVFKLTGKTGDGTVFTASLAAGPDHRYLMFVNPYKRVNSFLAGKLTLRERTSGGFQILPAGKGYDLQWKKASLLPKTTDKSYREGFGPLDVLVSMEPWVAPGKGETVAGLFGIDLETEVFEMNLGITVPNDRKPALLVINSKNALEVKYSGSGLVTDQKAFAKIFSGKVDPKTGKITATLNLDDTVPTTPGRFKSVKRKVVIEGVLLQFEDEIDAFASAFALLPPLDAKTGTTTSGGLVFEDIQTDPMVATGQSGLAGSYSGTFNPLVITPTSPDDIPAAGTVNFSISADLKTLTFNGRALPLTAYTPAAGQMSFTDKKNVKNIVTATLYFNPATLAIVSLDVTYTQVVGRESRFGTARSGNPNNITKLP